MNVHMQLAESCIHSLTWAYLHGAFKVQFTLVLWLGVRTFAGWAWVSGVWRSLAWLEARYALLEGGWRGNLFTTLLRDWGEGNQWTSHCIGVVSVRTCTCTVGWVCECVYVNMIVHVHTCRYYTLCGLETTYWVWNPCVLHCCGPTFHKIPSCSCVVAYLCVGLGGRWGGKPPPATGS